MSQDYFDDEYIDKPSKSEIKRRLEARQNLAEEMSKLSKDQWARLPLTDELREALLETPNVRSHGGIRRHIQFMGKLMGQLTEEEASAIKKTFIDIVGPKKAARMKI